ncbi:hypothetical protein KZ813_17880 [Sphingomonas sp. RHCKR7]|uniref:hypothetical protein n=1 Tax=Sphingomonas folli TaxID=2862497 RepID=UPI001CA59B95|nr:hypothetical protein [Sphingomonas folli]MBW6528715.1 hypothetical protein [Sphingomonas folli]
MDRIEADDPAYLYCSRVEHPSHETHVESELIGSGSFAKMVRLALSDPDDEVWRYSVLVNGTTIEGDDLREHRVR